MVYTQSRGLRLDLIIIIIIICCRGSRLITLLSQTPGGVGDCYIIPINIVTHCLPFPTLSLFQQHSSLSGCQQEGCNRFTYNYCILNLWFLPRIFCCIYLIYKGEIRLPSSTDTASHLYLLIWTIWAKYLKIILVSAEYFPIFQWNVEINAIL